MEMNPTKPCIISEIKNNKKILLFSPGSNIQDSIFSGLNFQHYENLTTFNSGIELEKYKSNSYDYFFIHGYPLRDFDTRYILNNNIKIKNFCIDLLGEGFDIDLLLKNNLVQSKTNLLDTNIKILIPFNHYNGIEEKYKNISFFKYDFGGPRIFCSRYNRQMIHGQYQKIGDDYISVKKIDKNKIIPYHFHPHNEVVMGLKWSNTPKKKLYMCLNREPRAHRIQIYNDLLNKKLIDYGYVTFNSNSDSLKVKKIKSNGNEYFETFNVPKLIMDESNFEGRFALHSPISKNSYIDLVTESSHTYLPFKTEKCVKPFYNLQFPIIFGHRGIINDLREMGFDMFDDIIDHSYDTIEVKSSLDYTSSDTELKSDMISNEILKLSKLDIHSLYIKNKERFLYNQENLYKKTITDNKIFQDLGKFIFGDDIEVKEYDFDKIKKIYI